MQDSIGEESLYMRTKDTMFHQFDKLGITQDQKAELVIQYSSQITVNLSSVAMQSAIQWAKEERDGAYTLAKIKADTENALAEFQLIKAQICKTLREEQFVCTQITKISGDSIRANGYVTEFEEDGCTVKLLDSTGLAFNQTEQVKGATYQIFADAFRKSGNVQIGTDIIDGIKKGLSGDDDGYTKQQAKNAERQRIAYEDSKRNHAANSASTMIGQLLSSEVLSESNEQDIQRWRDAIDFLLLSHTSTDDL